MNKKFLIVNTITCGRAPLVIVGCALSLANLWIPSLGLVVAATILLSLSALTDMFDGKLARSWGVTSRFGALCDPLMDKVFYLASLPTATFIALYAENFTQAYILLAADVISLLRDQWVSFLRTVGSQYGADVRATWSGKIRTIIGFPVITLAHLWSGCQYLVRKEILNDSLFLDKTMFTLEAIFIAVTVISLFTYTRNYMPFLKKACSADKSF